MKSGEDESGGVEYAMSHAGSELKYSSTQNSRSELQLFAMRPDMALSLGVYGHIVGNKYCTAIGKVHFCCQSL